MTATNAALFSVQTDWIQSTVRHTAAEAGELRPAGETVIARLADTLVIQAIRSWLDQDAAAPRDGLAHCGTGRSAARRP